MQSNPKNAHTGTGPHKTKGPVSANTIAIAENNPKTIPSTACKIENILAMSVMIKPENKSESELYCGKRNETMTPSPARGLTKPPTVQPEAVQPSETNLNNVTSDNVSLSQRKQPRVGKSMERERQQQQHIGYLTTLESVNHQSDEIPMEIPQFKQEFSVKREGEVKVEKDCEEIATTEYRSMNVKLERPESLPPKPAEKTNEELTVNLTVESGDECIDYSIKRKRIDMSSDDVIELSDNSTVEPTAMASLKRRKLLEKPVCTPKKSPPNSYKSLIKQSSPSSTFPSPTAKQKLITATINRSSGKASLKRRNILKSKMTLKKMRLAVKAKKTSSKKKAVSSDDSTKEENAEPVAIEEDSLQKSDDNVEEVSTENEQNEEKSMDGSSECSGKSNIDLTIDRVAKGYFSESDIFSCLSKHRKTKSQKKFAAKLLKKRKQDALTKTKKKKSKASKEADGAAAAIDSEKKKKTKLKDSEELQKKKPKKQECAQKLSKKKRPEVVEKDPLSIDEIPSSHSTPKQKPKTPKKTKKAKVNEVAEKTVESAVVESDDDDKTTVETLEPRDEETSTTVLSSTQTINTTKSILDETDVANNNNECFEDNNRQKQQESLTLYKTPGYGWVTFNKNKRGKKAKFSNRKKHKFALLNDIVIPKSTSIPRWSNGWVWEGEPFQALVFLNASLLIFLDRFPDLTPRFSNYRATIHQCQELASMQCVTRSVAMSSGLETAFC